MDKQKLDFVDECYMGKDLSQLSRVTVIIPTHNRNYYLSRCLWYHAHFPFGQIIVADSSSDEKRTINRKTIEEICDKYHVNITHMEYNFHPENYGGEIYRKWGDAVQHVETEYSLSCTDKEFLIPTAVCDAVRFLDEHPDYSIADSTYLMAESSRLVYPWQAVISFSSDNVTLRMQELIEYKLGVGTQFALRSSQHHKDMFKNLDKYNLYDLRFGEIEIELYPILSGKTHRDSTSYMSIRDVSKSRQKLVTVKTESSFLRYPFIYEYPNDRYTNLIQSLSDFISNTSRQNINPKLKESIIQSFIHGRYRADEDNMKQKLIRNVFPLFPYNMRRVLSKLFGSGRMPRKLTHRNKTSEIKLILKLIKITSKEYPEDLVVHRHLGKY